MCLWRTRNDGTDEQDINPGVTAVLRVELVEFIFPLPYIGLEQLSISMSSDDAELQRTGHIELKPGMAVFYRDLRGDRKPENDILKVWVEGEVGLKEKFGNVIDRLDVTRDELLGPDEELKGGEKGGTAVESSGRGRGNLQGDRCISLANSKEAPRMIHHPCKNMSQAESSDDNMLQTLSNLLRVGDSS